MRFSFSRFVHQSTTFGLQPPVSLNIFFYSVSNLPFYSNFEVHFALWAMAGNHIFIANTRHLKLGCNRPWLELYIYVHNNF
jgi:hypothetical protein